MEDFSGRLATIKDAISTAAHRAGRNPDDIELVAVSKTQLAESVSAALRAGVTNFGENMVQEARGKIEEVGRGIWHLIGHLQTSKAKDAVRLFDFIDSVDRLELAEEIDRRADAFGKTQNVLLQVNVAGESTKFGCGSGEARALAEALNALPRLALQGLMTQMALFSTPEKGLAGPFVEGDLIHLFRVQRKLEPTIENEAVRARLERHVIDAHFDELSAAQGLKSLWIRQKD